MCSRRPAVSLAPPADSPLRSCGRDHRPGAHLDNLTHALVGAAISKAGAERTTPLATATLVLAANAPDIDVLSYVRGSYFALSFRRGITHGWPALVVLPFLVTAAVLGWDRWVRRRRQPSADPVRAGPTLALSAIGVLTHPTLDWMNTYGMRWALPFDGVWSYGDALFIIDPWIWLTLGAAVFLAVTPGRRGVTAWAVVAAAASVLVLAGMPAARVGWVLGLALIAWLHREGRPRTPNGGRALAGVAVAVVALYIGALVLLDGVARNDVRRVAESAGLTPKDIMVAPVGGDLSASSVAVLTDAGFVLGTYRRFGSPRVDLALTDTVPLVTGPASIPRAALDLVIADARMVPAVHNYLVWSRYPYVAVEPDGDSWRVRFADARYVGELGAGGLGGVEVLVPRGPSP